jgi:putative ABC transport system permease protein
VARLTIKGLLAHKLRFALTALAVMLGIAFLSGTLVLTDTVQRTFDELFADVNAGTDALVRSRDEIDSEFGTQRQRVPPTLVPQIEAVDGVKVAEGQLEFYAQIVGKDGEAIGNPGMGAPTFGFNWSDVPELNPFDLEPGSRPPRQPGQIVIDKGSADDGDLEVGDRTRVLTQRGSDPYEIVGIAKFGDADSPAGASVTLFTMREAQAITGAGGQFDDIEVVGDKSVSEDTLRDRIADALRADGVRGVEVLTGAEVTQEDIDDIHENLAFFNTALTVFALIALFVGSFIIFNTFSIIVAQRIREMALLRAIGASGRQVLVSVLAEAVVVGIVASVIGILVGIGLSVLLKAVLAAFGFDIPAGGVVVKPSTIIISMIVGTGITVVAAVFPARRAARIPPVAAMREVAVETAVSSVRRTAIGIFVTLAGVAVLCLGLFGDVSNGIAFVGLGAFVVFLGVAILGPVLARPLSRVIGWPLPRIRGVTGRLARENAMRNPKRTAATAAALMIGVALVAFITIFAESTKQTINVQVDRAFKSDFVVTPGGFDFSGFSPEVAREIARSDDFDASSPLRFNEAEIDGSGEFLAALDADTANDLFDLDPIDGEFSDLTPTGIAVSEEAADDNNWRLGSEVPVRFAATGDQRLTIDVIYGTGTREGLTDYALSSDGYLANFDTDLVNQVYANLAPGVSAEEGRATLDRIVKPFPNLEVQDQTQFKEDQASQINQLLNLIYVLLFLAVLIAGIGIANTLALSVLERIRELGLLRAVGMSRAQLRSSVRWESVIIAVLGALLGIAIAIFFGWAVVEALKDEGISEFVAPPGRLLIIVIAAGVIGVIAALLPGRRAARLDILQAIVTE